MKTLSFYRLLCFVIILNVILFIYFLIIQHSRGHAFNRSPDFSQYVDIPTYLQNVYDKDVLSNLVTFCIRDYGDNENNLDITISSLHSINKNFVIIIIGDDPPYPPIRANFSGENKLHFLSTKKELDAVHPIEKLRKLITTPYILLFPDGANLRNSEMLMKMIKNFQSRKFISVLATKVSEEALNCPDLSLDKRTWTLKLTNFDGSDGMCDYVGGDQAALLQTDLLFQLSHPFGRPVLLSLYMQTSSRHLKAGIFTERVFVPRARFKDFMSEWKYKKEEEKRTENLMKEFGIKHVVYKGSYSKVINYGCNKDSQRCFGTVKNDVPDFIYEGKWTPPCCLNAIRETARHVFKLFAKSGVRYWLEGGSLLGAARNGDIIPWDYDVDIGIYRDDIEKSLELKKLNNTKHFVDDSGFLWEKATEGEFFRVHYSNVNRNHIDIFPFYSRDGIMTKNTWFKTHRQDMEFPEHFLKPLSSIEFIGMNVSAPNNKRKFLEMKFGEGVIENPKYSDNRLVI